MRVFKWILLFFLCAFISLAQVPQSHVETLTVPANRLQVAQTKAALITELRASIYEDHEGIFNPKREAKINELAHKLQIQER